MMSRMVVVLWCLKLWGAGVEEIKGKEKSGCCIVDGRSPSLNSESVEREQHTQ